MSDRIQKLNELVALANEPDPEHRRELLRGITDMFMENAESMNEGETDAFDDVMCHVARDVEMSVRQRLATKLSGSDSAPRNIVNQLANDEIEVAKPILKNSAVLTSDDLLSIIKNKSQEHFLLISARKTVQEDVADSLVEHGNDAVLVSLASNEGAVLSHSTLKTMADRSKNIEELQAPLLNRPKMPNELVNEVFQHGSTALRQYMLDMDLGLDDGSIDALLSGSQKTLEQAQKFVNPAEQYILKMKRLNMLNPSLLEQLVRENKIPETIAGISHMLNIDMTATQRMFFNEGGETLAIVCKASELSTAYYKYLLTLADDENKRSQESIASLSEIYERITPQVAQRTIRFWRTREQVKKMS